MEPSNLILFFFYCFLLTSGYKDVQGSTHHHHEKPDYYTSRPTKLFVFGDSYVDTGNIRKAIGNSWREPYGSTFPGKPAGRYSDGRVLTDFVAKMLGVKSPIASSLMKFGGNKLRNGMNFAYGGSGVFDTIGTLLPNMSTQIDLFEKLIDNNPNYSLYTKSDLESSVALVCIAGNDYAAYVLNGGTAQGLNSFIARVVNQLAMNLKRLDELGATKVIVASLPPVGCLPRFTQISSFKQCNSSQNIPANYHNLLLQQAVDKLNSDTKTSTFFILDLYKSFTTVFEQKGDYQGIMKFETPLKPCCMGISGNYDCGSVDEKGAKMYTVCSDPKSSFFWDSSHPAEAGWREVYNTFNSTLEQFLKVY